MAKSLKTQIYEQHILKDTLTLSYGVDYKTFEALKTCGLGEKSAHIQKTDIDPYLSTWLLQGEDLIALLENPSEKDYTFGEKLCSNLVLLGLNAGSMHTMTPAWHFFHRRYSKSNTEELIETASERYLKEYLTKIGLPFEGAYMTDILKFQDKTNSLYIEPNSTKVQSNDIIQAHNFAILKKELELLHKNSPDTKMLLVPLGSKCHSCLKAFLAWTHKEKYECDWLVVPQTYMAHYSQAGWNNERSKNRASGMKEWCGEHVI